MSAVSSIADFLSKGLDVAEPLISDAEAQKYTKGATERKAELGQILSLPGGDNRANLLSAYFKQLCSDYGSPCIGLGDAILVPADYLLALGGFGCDGIAETALANQLIHKLSQ